VDARDAPANAPDAPAASQEGANRHQADNDRSVREVLESIAGREGEPAGRVFKNIRLEWYQDIPAKQLLLVMDLGFSRALGVSCTHCHVSQDFSSDDKRPKRAAREMARMLKTIGERLGQMEHLDTAPDERGINCATCHRGRTNPRQKADGR
jgi:hypothetical protein